MFGIRPRAYEGTTSSCACAVAASPVAGRLGQYSRRAVAAFATHEQTVCRSNTGCNGSLAASSQSLHQDGSEHLPDALDEAVPRTSSAAAIQVQH